MFTEVPTLVGREFIVGFLLPAIIFFIISAFPISTIYLYVDKHQETILSDQNSKIRPDEIAHEGDVINVALQKIDGSYALPFILIVITWVLALLLLSLNWIILRIFEGYALGKLVVYCFGDYKKRFDKTARRVLEHQKKIDNARERGSAFPAYDNNHAKNLWTACREFPDNVSFVLPTKFGNRFRSFEVYSRVVYGLDAIPAWPRLLMVMPESARQMITQAKIQVDFCVNITVIFILAVPIWLLSLRFTAYETWIWIFAVNLLLGVLSWLGYRMASDAVLGLGELVKSAFDLYRPNLARALGLKHPEKAEDEWAMWEAVSRMMIYRSAAQYRRLNEFRRPQAEMDKFATTVDSGDDD